MRRRFLMWALFAAWTASAEEVVVYTALDEYYSAPVFAAFEEKTGIDVRPVYDTEASKTTGLVNRLIAEQRRPRADVFWNNEVAQTIVLKEKGVLAPYASPAGETIPEAFKDPEHYWTGLAARARVVIYNTDQVDTPPASIADLLDPAWKGKAAIANPLFGTTRTHASALFAAWGEERAKAFFAGLKENDVAVLPGNAQVRDMVGQGVYAWGLTDTDDANGGVLDGLPVAWRFPDQGENALGTLLIPNAVSLIEGAPNPEQGRRLIDYLLSAEVEAALAKSRSLQIPLHPGVEKPGAVPDIEDIRAMEVTFDAVAQVMEGTARYLQEQFLR